MKDPAFRSYASIDRDDLLRLLRLTRADRQEYFARFSQKWGAYYADRVICTALCQGAALHYACGEVGINDFDVYTFYAATRGAPGIRSVSEPSISATRSSDDPRTPRATWGDAST